MPTVYYLQQGFRDQHIRGVYVLCGARCRVALCALCGARCIEARERGEREREEDRLALRAARPHTVGFVRGCEQEEGGVECPCPPSTIYNRRLADSGSVISPSILDYTKRNQAVCRRAAVDSLPTLPTARGGDAFAATGVPGLLETPLRHDPPPLTT